MRAERAPALLWAAATVAFALWFGGGGFPGDSECAYLLSAYRTTHPEILRSDWTFGTSHAKTFLFDLVVGGAATVFPVDWIGRVGQLGVAIGVLVALIRIARAMGLTAPVAGIAIGGWLVWGQAVVGNEHLLGGFGPKAGAYLAGLFALDSLLRNRWNAAGILLGLSVALHPSVGVGMAVGLATGLVGMRASPRQAVRVVGLAALAALPGLLPLVAGGVRPMSLNPEDWRFETLVRMEAHLDFRHFSNQSLAALVAMLGFVWLHSRSDRDNKPLRFLVATLVGLTGVFLFGVAATLLRRYQWLSVYPFRVLPPLAQLLFFVSVAKAYSDGLFARPRWALGATALAAFLLLPSPGSRVVGRLTRGSRQVASDPQVEVARWLRTHTAAEALVVASPANSCLPYWSHRPQIALWGFTRLDDLGEWRRRAEALVGPPQPRMSRKDIEASFDRRTEAEIQSIVGRYGGDYLVSRSSYGFPVVFEAGPYRVFNLGGLRAAALAHPLLVEPPRARVATTARLEPGHRAPR